MGKRTLLTISACFLLGACTVPPTGEAPKEAIPPEERTETIGDMEVRGETLAERLLPSGILEIGNRDADMTLLLFTEHHCRYCREFMADHYPKLLREFIAPGHLRFQIAILPLKKYQWSETAAAAMRCAALQNAGVAMHRKLLEPLGKKPDDVTAYAAELQLDTDLFAQCLKSQDAADAIESQRSLARSLAVTLVPTFFLDGEKHIGLPYYPDLKGMIEEALNE